MTNKILTGECLSCESTYGVEYMEELVSAEYPEFCPFCGETIESITEEVDEEDDEIIDDEQWD